MQRSPSIVAHALTTLVLVLIALSGLGAAASASVPVRETSIAEGAQFDLSPFSFSVAFGGPVDLVDARLVDQEGLVTPIDLSFTRTRAALFVLELPVLVPHGYRLYWRVRERGGALTNGSVGFVVKGCDDPKLKPAR